MSECDILLKLLLTSDKENAVKIGSKKNVDKVIVNVVR